MNFKISSDFAKNILTPVLGFGLAGAVWGIEAYLGIIGSDDNFVNPFSYILGAIAFGLIGSLSLVLFSGDIKKILKVIGLGFLGWVIAFLGPAVVAYQLMIGGAISLAGLLSVLERIGFSHEGLLDFSRLFGLDSSFDVGNFWIEFLLTGAIIGLIYALILKLKILRTVLYGAIGFAIASLISPIIGNLIGNLFGVLPVNYLITFILIGIILGLSLVKGGLRRQAGP